MPTPTILVAGATGNTGRAVVENLSHTVATKSRFAGYRILALTRSRSGAAAQRLAQLPHVEVVEKSWVEVTPAYLREQAVERAFIASHLEPSQFAEESTFHVALLAAGVRYVVRISTNAPNVRPGAPVYYARAHWAVEALLGSPDFAGLAWSSLQPNAFTPLFLSSASAYVKSYRRTGKLETLSLMGPENVGTAPIHPDDIGAVAAHLLSEEDFSRHNRAKYVLNGPVDVTGRQIVELVERAIGTKVEDVKFQDTSFVDDMASQSRESKNVILSIKNALVPMWNGETLAASSSPEIVDLGLLKKTPAETWKTLIE